MIEAKQKESLEIVVPDAISEPRTMVVHLGDTHLANAAVMSSEGLPVFASNAHVLHFGF